MGVITYVTLCGNFPFDVEDDPNFDLLDDPERFLYVDSLWENISLEG
jgi:hypothetical protein